jgi:hypothetical protein
MTSTIECNGHPPCGGSASLTESELLQETELRALLGRAVEGDDAALLDMAARFPTRVAVNWERKAVQVVSACRFDADVVIGHIPVRERVLQQMGHLEAGS